MSLIAKCCSFQFKVPLVKSGGEGGTYILTADRLSLVQGILLPSVLEYVTQVKEIHIADSDLANSVDVVEFM